MTWLEGILAIEFAVIQHGRVAQEHTYSLDTLPEVERCADRCCDGGGLNLQVALPIVVEGGTPHFYCQGYLRATNATSRRSPCIGRFEIRIARVLRASPSADEQGSSL